MSMMYYREMFIEELARKKEAKEVLMETLDKKLIYSKLRVRKIKGKEYLYVYSSKDHKEVYIGANSPELMDKYNKIIHRYNKIKIELREVDKDIPKIEKIIHYLQE